MVKNRNPITVAILSAVTCGIYYLVWAWSITHEIAATKGEDFNIVDFLVMIIIPLGFFMNGKKFVAVAAEKGVEVKDNTIICTIAGFFGALGLAVATYLMQTELNKLAD